MKKSVSSVLAFLLCAAMLISLCACQGKPPVASEPTDQPMDVAALCLRLSENMAALTSYKTSSVCKMSYHYYGDRFDVISTTTSIETSTDLYTEGTNVIVCEALSVNETMHTIEAFVDGKMYLANKGSTYDQKFCSEMTLEDFKAAQSASLVDGVNLSDCKTATYTAAEQGGGQLVFSGYTKDTINKLMGNVGLSDELLGAAVIDMKSVLTVSPDYYVKQLQIQFVFDADIPEIAPEFTATMAFSDFQTAAVDAAVLNAEEYASVEDVRILENVEESIQQRQDSAAGKFTMTSKTTLTLPKETQVSTETDVVFYGRVNGAYYYNITATSDNETILLQYQGGLQTIVNGEHIVTLVETDEDAKLTVDALIDSADYLKETVTDIELREDGVLVLKIANFDVSLFADSFASIGVVATSASQEIAVTMEGDSIAKLESKIMLEGTYDGKAMTAVVETAVCFEEVSIEED